MPIVMVTAAIAGRAVRQTLSAATANVLGAKVQDAQPCSKTKVLLAAALLQMQTGCLVLALATIAVPACISESHYCDETL